MSEVEALLKIDWVVVFVAVFALIMAINKWTPIFTSLWAWIEGIVEKKKRRQEDSELLHTLVAELENERKLREENVRQSIEKDDKLQASIDRLGVKMDKHIQDDNERTIVSLRSTLWRIHSEAMENQRINREGLVTFMECGRVYEAAGGNDIYHDKLLPEVMSLPVKERGED